ncbi:DUF1266 domain-containing protein [Halomonas sp. MCCC 1A17488]|uniref:DUF1266 domain-containing protein n=1 Tax=unclassified Halomonas TaxID=2609666 RepID=UPI0018D23802|nr:MULTISPECIES: DUF1266 domain-containing protein [unclassified Halomonas]MCE8015856.1 DUF1266 domain-containing protein [Halomonas sp. MCCC 1A17488]MCG3239189.1 DUF1266 domain-containing protein [Halomonas sp. MCCC 1A17488]QPP50874.1 DUF1266 domain-containing protein [Halomonas sp. SS10-MC5]
MVDPLYAWWAQQLVLCDWAFEPEPDTIEVQAASARLQALGVNDRGELGWRLVEAFGTGTADPARLLAALELLALAGSAGWLSESRLRNWLVRLTDEITRQYPNLESWLGALRHAKSAEGWVRGDDGFWEACEALAVLERDGEGVTWDTLTEWVALQRQDKSLSLWPDAPHAHGWRLRAAFAPVVEVPPGEVDWPDAKEWLWRYWQIDDRAGLVQSLLWLAGYGHRQGWDLDATRLLAASGDERQAWLDGLASAERDYGRVLLAFIERGEPLEWAAWDWLRLVDLAWAGACAGWLDVTEARDFASHGADLVLRRYSDWSALARAYQRGCSLFEGQDRLPDMQRDWNLLLNSPVSPWRAPLQQLLSEEERESSRRSILAWRRPPRHWVLALASVREPEFGMRQGPPVAVAVERRGEALRYLDETLGLHPDEGVEALARYWLPAQAHHLNQLAADAAHGALPAATTPFGRPEAEDRESLVALKQGSRHAATIHMAEKYAFYLQMAMDSEAFDGEALEALAEALRGTLCRFYPDARRLLEAWSQWERLLPEGEHPPLINEIRWHLDDPGSPFHWLDWHSSQWREPGPRPTLSRFTAMALVGPLNSAAWSEPHVESEREAVSIREWIDGHYGLHGEAELHEFLDFLLEAGDRQEYQINYAPYTLNTQRLASEIAMLESGDCSEEDRTHLLRLQRVRDNTDGCNELDMTAWDVAQAVDLAIAGRQLGWLDGTAFSRVLERAHALAAEHYGSWEAYARGLYAGFSFFMGETSERKSFLDGFRQALVAWLSGAPPLAGPWASLDFPGARPRHWAPMHIDTLPGDVKTLH